MKELLFRMTRKERKATGVVRGPYQPNQERLTVHTPHTSVRHICNKTRIPKATSSLLFRGKYFQGDQMKAEVADGGGQTSGL